MWNAPIVEEVRKVRNAHAKKFGYDLKAIANDLIKQQQAASVRSSHFPVKSRLCCQR